MTGVFGAVLCGGASSRMGVDKATIPVDGVAMARRVADVLDFGVVIAAVRENVARRAQQHLPAFLLVDALYGHV